MTADDPATVAHPEHRVGQLRPVVIGEQQDRVDYAAARFGGEVYAGLPEHKAAAMDEADLRLAELQDNEDWINRMKEENRLIIDTGPAESRASYPQPTRPPGWPRSSYEVETDAIQGYPNVIRPWHDTRAEPNFPWTYDPSTYDDGVLGGRAVRRGPDNG
jgi:hypothetical protein